jgi:hypothetical protein
MINLQNALRKMMFPDCLEINIDTDSNSDTDHNANQQDIVLYRFSRFKKYTHILPIPPPPNPNPPLFT